MALRHAAQVSPVLHLMDGGYGMQAARTVVMCAQELSSASA
jgi:hypothetical protein